MRANVVIFYMVCLSSIGYGLEYAELSVDNLLKIRNLSQGAQVVLHHGQYDKDTQVSITDNIDRTYSLTPDNLGRFTIKWEIIENYRGGKITTNKPKGSMQLSIEMISDVYPGEKVKDGRLNAADIKIFYVNGMKGCDQISKIVGGKPIRHISMKFSTCPTKSFKGTISGRTYESRLGVLVIPVTDDDIKQGSDLFFNQADIKFIKTAQQVDSAEASTIAVPPSSLSGSPR